MHIDKETLSIQENVMNSRALRLLINLGYKPYYCDYYRLIWIKGLLDYKISRFLLSNDHCNFIYETEWPTIKSMPKTSLLLNTEGETWYIHKLEVDKVLEIFRG